MPGLFLFGVRWQSEAATPPWEVQVFRSATMETSGQKPLPASQAAYLLPMRFFLIFALAMCLAKPLGAEKFNVVFILVDDWGWADAGVQGSDFFETPNIDRLAGQGVRFTQAYAAAAICSPTRAAILTGK